MSCSDKKTGDWRQFYIDQEKSKITTIQKSFEYSSSGYSLTSVDSTYETFNEKHQKLGINNMHFYKYDTDGKVIAEEYCMRTCEKPGKEIYYYDSLNRLTKTKVIVSGDNKWVSAKYFYNDKNLLTKKIIGNDSTPTTETYTYDRMAHLTTKTRKEFNTNVNEWLTIVDSMFYGSDNNMILKKRYHIGEDLMTISKYSYKDTLLMSQVDTTITTIKEYLPTPETFHHAYYFRVDYKYNSDNKIIEKITTQPDYKTPAYKVTYEYK
ncbi:MAG: hypothetical protein ACXVED_08430 [Bacteroidia bacterium]